MTVASRLTILVLVVSALGSSLVTDGGVRVDASPSVSVATKEWPPLVVNDPAVTSGMAWHLDDTNARAAWRASLGGGVTVAVIDTGVDHAHPDLLGQVEDRATCLDTGGDRNKCRAGGSDPDGHGTHVAGLIAARADNGEGSAGVAPRARLISVRAAVSKCKAADCLASADPSDLAASIDWAVAHHADIINLSIDPGRRTSSIVADALNRAWDAGAAVVMAAGNSSEGPVLFATGAALLVTATDRAGNLAPYAPNLDSANVALAAPGGRQGDTPYTCHLDGRPIGVLSTYARSRGDRSGYACLSGTSMATAQVSGGLALLLSMGYSRDDALERLVDTARPAPGLADGLIDLAAAVAEPHPLGVNYRHDSLDNGAAQVIADQVPVVGPFARETTGSGREVALWPFLLGGAALAGALAEMVMRTSRRDRRRPARDTPDRPTA